jgi:1-piperideine-2-carboxylate/1-pyrroline-2-carboxylate reductase [NAD(P)H]
LMSKNITVVSENTGRGLPAIQGDVLVFDPETGERQMVLTGPTVTARRTAAVSLLAAQVTGFTAKGPMLIVGAGVQGRAHLDAFHEGLGIDTVLVASRSPASVDALVAYAQDRGLHAQGVDDPNTVLGQCTYVVTTTTASGPVMHEVPAVGSFVAAVGAFTPKMSEWSVSVCQTLASTAQLVVDTPDAAHEAGDLLQANIDVAALPSLAHIIARPPAWCAPELSTRPTVFFKSCGWAGWDLAAAQCALANRSML